MADALARLEAVIEPLPVACETVPLANAAGRILAHDLVATAPVPPFTNAAVDGWAFAHASLAASGGTLERIEGRAAAGHVFESKIGAGQTVRVLTGAPIPEGADTVALDEDCRVLDAAVEVPTGLKSGANARPAGEDMAPGHLAVPAGRRLRAPDLGLAAQLQLSQVAVRPRLRVALASTGDELRPPGAVLPPGAIVDANRSILRPMLERLGFAVTDLGILPDDEATVAAVLNRAAATHDAIVTSGGASRSEEDHVVRVVQRDGEFDFWRIAIKPGRPLGLGRLNEALFVALPGNPVAATVCFLRFARPMLLQRAGAGWDRAVPLPLAADFSFKKPVGRTEFLRGRLATSGDGAPCVQRIAREGSGRLTSLGDADGLIELDAQRTVVAPGEIIDWLPFSAFGCV